jgi:NAD(P)-dependent dehydrogenase (short-subunit alcohol dehydrogenase family)
VSAALAGRVALVTGAAAGIGRASARAFASAGAQVLVADVDAGGGEETVLLIAADGGEATFARADVTDASDAQRLVASAVERWGRLDCAHNNAGILGETGRTAEVALETWHRVIAIDLTGVFLGMRAQLAQMLAQGGGAIVNTSSASGLIGTPGLAAYTAAKHGVVGLTRSAALEYAQDGIRVNAICPGATQTPMLTRAAGTPELIEHTLSHQPIGRIADPNEVAQAAVWLCSDAASFVTGAALPVDGGMTAQ